MLFRSSGENADLLDRQRDACRDSAGRLTRTFANAIARGQLPKNLDRLKSVTWLHSLLTGVIMSWLPDPEVLDLERAATDFVDTCLFALQHSPSLRTSPGL